MFGTLGLPEVLIILVIGVLVFGGVKLPGIIRSLSSGVRGFRKVRDTVRNPIDLDQWIVDEKPHQEPPFGRQYYDQNQNPQDTSGQGQQWGYQPPPQGWQQNLGGEASWPPPSQGGFPPQSQQPPNTQGKREGPENPDRNSDPPRT